MPRTAPARPALLRTLNDRTVLDLLLSRGPSSRTDLAGLTGLSKPTIAEALTRLERAGLVVDAGETVGRRGPNGRLHDVTPGLSYGAALTVEPGRLTCAVVDVRGAVLATATRPRADLPPGAAASSRALVDACAAEAGIDHDSLTEVVVGLPGSYDPVQDRVRYADRIPDWTAPGLSAELEAAFDHRCSVSVDNDVNLALVAERTTGAATGSSVTSLLWLATGIGLATDLDGTLYRGVAGGAGEIGYIPLPAPAGITRRPGGQADFQDLVGGTAVRRLAREHGVPGRTAAQAVERAAATHGSDPAAEAFLDELARRISLGLTVIVAVLDPGLVVLGGAVGRAGGPVLATRTARALRRTGPLTAAIAASTVAGDPSLAGARVTAAARARERLLDAATRAVADERTGSPDVPSLPLPRTALGGSAT